MVASDLVNSFTSVKEILIFRFTHQFVCSCYCCEVSNPTYCIHRPMFTVLTAIR